MQRDSNSALAPKRKAITNSKNSIGKRKISSEQKIELLDKTIQLSPKINNRTNQNKVSIPSHTVNKITTEIDLRKDQYLSNHSKITILPNLKNQAYGSIPFKAKNSSSTVPTVLNDRLAEFSSDQHSESSNFFNYETKSRKHKNINHIYTSTDSYTSCRDNIPITTIQSTPPFSKSEGISSDPSSTIRYKKLIQSRKKTNNNLLDTDISISKYEDDNSSTSPNYHYNSDSSFKLSINSSSSSVKKQQYKQTEHNINRTYPNLRKHNNKIRNDPTKK